MWLLLWCATLGGTGDLNTRAHMHTHLFGCTRLLTATKHYYIRSGLPNRGIRPVRLPTTRTTEPSAHAHPLSQIPGITRIDPPVLARQDATARPNVLPHAQDEDDGGLDRHESRVPYPSVPTDPRPGAPRHEPHYIDDLPPLPHLIDMRSAPTSSGSTAPTSSNTRSTTRSPLDTTSNTPAYRSDRIIAYEFVDGRRVEKYFWLCDGCTFENEVRVDQYYSSSYHPDCEVCGLRRDVHPESAVATSYGFV